MTTTNRNAFTAQLEGKQTTNQDARTPGVFNHKTNLASKGYIPPLQRDVEDETVYISFEIPSTLVDAMTGLLTHENISPDIFISKLIEEGIKEIAKNPRFAGQLRGK